MTRAATSPLLQKKRATTTLAACADAHQLIHIDKHDLDEVQRFFADPRLQKYLPTHTDYLDQIPKATAFTSLPSLRRKRFIALGLTDHRHQWLGLAELNRLAAGQYEVGYVIKPSRWRRGLGRLLLTSVLQFSQECLGATSWVAHTTAAHPAAVPLLQSCAFKWVGRVRVDLGSQHPEWVDRYER